MSTRQLLVGLKIQLVDQRLPRSAIDYLPFSGGPGLPMDAADWLAGSAANIVKLWKET
ncbi:unnamed protein product [Penicillium roqueforti FM164]|uniref:Genomic scaffold, ProqFM164S03 n=1 Tax=Penicillium roqueforti (strain FM164) TaxID=1365484 RepID=W6QEH0_PENRF|nr:unnamed protein product [Penicillium roqueforti FM164]